MLINLLGIDEVLVNNLNTNIACTYCIHEVTINLMTIENVIDIKNDDKKNSKRETNYTIGITKVQLSVFVLQTVFHDFLCSYFFSVFGGISFHFHCNSAF